MLALLAEGASNGQIAAQLVIADETAKTHVKRILRKLGATNRVEAATDVVARPAGSAVDRAGPRRPADRRHDLSTRSQKLLVIAAVSRRPPGRYHWGVG